MKKHSSIKPALWGIFAGTALLAVYFLVMTLLNSWNDAWYQFLELWPWMTALAAGFGFQVGLYVYTIEYKKRTSAETASVSISGGVSAGSMIACCAHHVSDAAPFLGVGSIAIFAGKYQYSFLLLGIFSNLLGSVYMLKKMKECRVESKNPSLKGLLGMNHSLWLKIILAVGIIAVIGSFVLEFMN